jgi:hypothetical protein
LAESKFSIHPAAVVIAIVLAAGGFGFWQLDRASKQPAPPPPPLSGEARAYVSNLKLSGVDMSAHDAYFGQRVVEITGMIQNTGPRMLQMVDVNCVFHDPYGQVVLRQRVPIVGKKVGGLEPGATKPFRLPFDNIPDDWNNMMPQLVIARIDFQ